MSKIFTLLISLWFAACVEELVLDDPDLQVDIRSSDQDDDAVTVDDLDAAPLSTVVKVEDVDFNDVDFNKDNEVNILDLVMLAACTDSTQQCEISKQEADLNKDGEINKEDLAIVSKFFSAPTVIKAEDVDFNKDNEVNILDLVMLAACTDSTRQCEISKQEADLNKDGEIDKEDLAIVSKFFSNNPAAD